MVRPSVRWFLAASLGVGLVAAWLTAMFIAPGFGDSPSEQVATEESDFISNPRQITFEGRRAGEGYYSRDGKRMVFQSERESGNPFFQIYVMDLENGDIERVSPGVGKTTCSWIHPDGRTVLFASTHDDLDCEKKQRDEIALRASGKERRYAWDYDEHFELYAWDQDSKAIQRLTNARGYDAEGSYSPDGNWIAFASNRHAYEASLNAKDRKAFEVDPSIQVDLYRMRADGSEIQRLTDVAGYDGGPFFNPDGSRICFRRFSTDGATAEIMVMNADGSDSRAITRLGAMSWAPFYHPSGRYLIFTTNLHGFANFELYLVDSDGKSPPVRVTHTDGFDGLASFSPDGENLTWTSNRGAEAQSQIFVAKWDHAAALRSLGLTDETSGSPSTPSGTGAEPASTQAGAESARDTAGAITTGDLIRHVDYLCRPELEGRLTGTIGEQMATAYVAAFMDQIGLQPAGDDGTFYQPFEFTAGVDLGKDNLLTVGNDTYEVNRDWRPLAFSTAGKFEPATVVFAGYGIVAPKDEDEPEYDSYVHLDIRDKWVLALRYLPDDVSPERRQHLARFSSLRHKAMTARDRGARGLILVPGPGTIVKDELVALQFDGSMGDSALPVISVTNAVATEWLSRAGKDLGKLQKTLDAGEPQMGIVLEDVKLTAEIDIDHVRRTGRNVLGRLVLTSAAAGEPVGMVVLGAHIDHLGRGRGGNSLARENEEDLIHFGADDNASGVAAVLEIAQNLREQSKSGNLPGKRDLLVACWSGEELGLLGSAHFAKTFMAGEAHAGSTAALYPRIAACVNLDMVGRLKKKLVLQGISSSSIWKREIEQRNVPIGLPLTLQADGYLPTDASSFYTRGVPILSAFTGSHSEYHTPRDTPDTLNYDGAAQVTRLIALITRSLLVDESVPDFIEPTQAAKEQPRALMQAFLGTIPDYAETDKPGVVLSGAKKDGPAAKAGVIAGDRIVELAGKKIANIYDYTYAIGALKVGQEVTLIVVRDGKRVKMKVTPGAR